MIAQFSHVHVFYSSTHATVVSYFRPILGVWPQQFGKIPSLDFPKLDSCRYSDIPHVVYIKYNKRAPLIFASRATPAPPRDLTAPTLHRADLFICLYLALLCLHLYLASTLFSSSTSSIAASSTLYHAFEKDKLHTHARTHEHMDGRMRE